MATREDLLKNTGCPQPPIFEIMTFEHPNKELIYPSGKHSGFPDIGSTYSAGFYYELDTAIKAMHENWGDIREAVANAGFILCRHPGLYNSAGPDLRMYFLWDDDLGGFYEAEEPEIFRHMAY